MNTIDFQSTPVQLNTFSYDSENPTYYTECLSFYVLQMFDLLSQNGARIHIETVTPEEQGNEVSSWLSSFQTWLSDCESAISAWLLESEESRALPVLLSAPAWPAAIGAGAVLLYRGALVKAGVDGVTSLMRIAQQATANRRQGELVRLLDRALLRGSWFSIEKESRIEDIRIVLSQILESFGNLTTRMTVEDKNGSYSGIGQALYDCLSAWELDKDGNPTGNVDYVVSVLKKLATNPNIIKLLSKVILTHGGDIDEHEFILAGEDE